MPWHKKRGRGKTRENNLMKGVCKLKRKLLSIITACTLVLSIAMPTSLIKAQAATNGFDTTRYGDTIDIGRKLRNLENDEAFLKEAEKKIKENASKINFDEEEGTTDGSQDSNFTTNLGTKKFLDYELYFKDFTLRSRGDNVEIWVANDLSFPDDRPAHVITQEQVDRMRDTFDEVVYPTDTEFFGTPDSHDGSHAVLSAAGYVPENYYASEDGKERVIILVDNVPDEQYYDPSYPFFVAGFYWGTLEYYIDRNIITIDSKDWATRLDTTFLPTTAHEFQHLIHADNSPGEDTWINEGMSDFAEYLCFDEHPWGHVNYFLDHPENSLIYWDEYYGSETGPETLADYGQAYLMQLYLFEQYGKEFTRALAQSPEIGIESLNNLLLKDDTDDRDFNDIFRDMNTALVVDSEQPGAGRYNFKTIDLQVDFTDAALHAKDGVPAWGSDFLEIKNANRIVQMNMNGVALLPATPTVWEAVYEPVGGETVLWGNNGDDKDNFLIFEADLNGIENATLTFDHLVQIEAFWDFGFVQVSTDDGKTWTSLSNENTTSEIDPDGAASIRANLPGFTGVNNDWQNESFDLSEYAGQKVYIAFRYMTDSAVNEAGWFIKDISISEIDLIHAGDSLDRFMSLTELAPKNVTYQLAFINQTSLGKGKNSGSFEVLQIDPYNVTEEQSIMLEEFFEGGNNYMVIWYIPEKDTKDPVPYSYEITTRSEVSKKKNSSKKSNIGESTTSVTDGKNKKK
ncbi:MAG: peptidase [Anaerosolibacter sp.]|jgi:hypothetical protein|nr:peptidase [Anaerosolibacter sp.]